MPLKARRSFYPCVLVFDPPTSRSGARSESNWWVCRTKTAPMAFDFYVIFFQTAPAVFCFFFPPKRQVFDFVLRPAMSGSDTVALRKRREAELEVAEIKMLSFSSGDRISADPGGCDSTATSLQVNGSLCKNKIF